MQMTIRVPPDRSVAGLLTIAVRDRPADAAILACATSSIHSRAPHAAYGRYVLHEVRVNEPAEQAEYGSCRLVFEPESGEALAAEARGILTLDLHGGDAGPLGRLRRTSGGVRVANDALIRIARLVSAGERVSLDIVAEPLPWWNLFARWNRRLSPDPDERDETQDDDWRTSSSSSSGTSSGSRRDDTTWTGGGGTYAGAGSSGGWNEGARTAAAAGVVAAAATAAAAAATEAAEGSAGSSESAAASDAPGATTY